MIHVRHIVFVLFTALSIQLLFARIPDNYYDNAKDKNSALLKTALHLIINPHTQLNYLGLATTFKTSDWHPGGYFWDMYSNEKRSTWSGSGLNREHNMPKSWFGVAGGQENTWPIGTDLHNLYPSNGVANSAKSNFPLGVVGSNPIFSNGVVKVGKSVFPGYSGTVFEPADEYKGDFARCYMYMVTSYEDYSTKWQSTGTASMLNNNTYPVFQPYAINLLLEWHREDPVSVKETDRNDVAYNLQGNRNPFVDYPVLAELIWGEYIGDEWDGTNNNPGTFYISYKKEEQKLFVSLREPLKSSCIIYATTGLKVFEGKPDADGYIEMSSIPKGLYIAVIYANGKRRAEKFLHGESY